MLAYRKDTNIGGKKSLDAARNVRWQSYDLHSPTRTAQSVRTRVRLIDTMPALMLVCCDAVFTLTNKAQKQPVANVCQGVLLDCTLRSIMVTSDPLTN